MKLLIATGLYPPDIGGPATYTVFLEKHLEMFGIEFIVLPFGVVRKYPKIIRHLVYTIKLMHASKGCEVLYALDTISVGLPTMIACFFTRKKMLLRVPGDYAWEQGQQRYGIKETLDEYLTHEGHYQVPVRVLAYIQGTVARRADAVIVPSDYMKTVVAKWGVQKERVTRVYSGLKIIAVPETKEVLRATFGYKDFVMVTAARLVPWKGISLLIDITHTMRTSGTPVSLLIIGDGVCRKEFEEQVDSLGATSYIHFTGAISREELGRQVKAADAFVLNTSYEGLSHQLIEVMSIGTPIVTTNVGGNPELIIDGETGLLTLYNDGDALRKAIENVIHDRTRSLFRSENAKKYVARFHEDVVIKEFVECINQLSSAAS